MPNYVYRHCLDFEVYHPIGNAPMTEPCPECSRAATLVIGAGVQIAPSALETKGQEVRDTNAREKRWDADMPAYKRMRNKGMQPHRIDGAARVEDNVGDQLDIEYGHMYGQTPDHSRENFREAAMEVEERSLMGQNTPIKKDYTERKKKLGVEA